MSVSRRIDIQLLSAFTSLTIRSPIPFVTQPPRAG
jgi:hypothetical protein